MTSVVFRKHHGASVKESWRRAKALEEVCRQVDGVSTPRAVNAEMTEGWVEYERIVLPTPLGEMVGDNAVFEQLGKMLARMHRACISTEELGISHEPYPLEQLGVAQQDLCTLKKSFANGWLHGDFWHGNVFHQGPNGFVVLDPVPAKFLDAGYFFGSGALDVAFMCMGLLFAHPLRRQVFLDFESHWQAGDAFTRGYLIESDTCSSSAIGAVRRLTRSLATRYIDAYANRLLFPIASIKRAAAGRPLRLIDERIGRRM